MNSLSRSGPVDDIRPGPPRVVGAHRARLGPSRTAVQWREPDRNWAGQELVGQLDLLERAGCRRVFSEKISTWVRVRPELENALALAREIKQAAPDQAVILTVGEMKRLARNAAELMILSAALQSDGIQLELLTGPLTGVYDPSGMGSMLFEVLAVAAQLDRDYIRGKTLEGQKAAAARGRHGGRPPVIDPDSLIYGRALHAAGTPVPDIASKLTIKTGKNAGRRPSVASVYRALAATSAGTKAEPLSAIRVPFHCRRAAEGGESTP